MEKLLILLAAVTVLLSSTSLVASTTAGATDEPHAQANNIGSGEASSGVGDDNFLLVRRYIPRFVGKREPSETDIETSDSDNFNSLPDDEKLFNDYVNDLLNLNEELENNDIDLEGVDKEYYDEESESNMDNENVEDDDYKSIDSQEDFSVGKRHYTPMFVGKRYQPRFVGKRYTPRFVGKRYTPMFVGKRYVPQFVGKRYQPKFIGKRYVPQFVGKRYQPKFVGKRYQPKFIGKRYQPKFIGKRYQPKFVGKRYQPKFIGKRYQPRFVGKRYQPLFVGKKSSPSEIDNLESLHENGHIEKRSTDTEITQEHENKADSNTERSSRKKRSVLISMDPVEKRFVAPEFIGRRDSLSSILSALDALQFARDNSRSTTKRFEAPLFIGKRFRPMFVGKRNLDNVNEMLTDKDFDLDSHPSDFNLGAYERLQDGLYPYEETYSPYSEFSSDKL